MNYDKIGTRNKNGCTENDQKRSSLDDIYSTVVDFKRRTSVDSQTKDYQRRSNWKTMEFGPNGRNITELKRQNTYRTFQDSTTRFSANQVKPIVTTILEETLEEVSYKTGNCGRLCAELADTIRDKVKLLNFSRHKLVCDVTIGEARKQGLELASLCLWDTKSDDFVSVSYRNRDLFAVAIIYGIYYE